MKNDRLLSAVAQLASIENITHKDVENALNISLLVDQQRTRPSYIMFQGTKGERSGAPTLESVELRSFTGEASAKGVLLCVKLSDDAELQYSDIIEKFGYPVEVDVPSPEDSHGASVIYIYRSETGETKFQADAESPKKIVSVAIDRTQ